MVSGHNDAYYITTCSDRVLFEAPHFDVLQIEAADGQCQWGFCIRNCNGLTGGLSGSSVLMLEIQRHGQNWPSLQYPENRIEQNEDAVLAARREPAEEVDLVCDTLEPNWLGSAPARADH